MKTIGIYKIINKINSKYYVGSSKEIYKRFNNHISELNKIQHVNNHLQNAWNKYGKENFEFVVIEKNISEKDLLLMEQKYLDIAKTEKNKCYNLSFIANKVEFTNEIRKKLSNSHIGKKFSDEHKKRIGNKRKGQTHSYKTRLEMSLSRRGKNHPMYGKHHSENSKEKMRLCRIGKHHSSETKLKMSISKMGINHTEKRKRKVSESNSKEWKFFSPSGILVEIKNLLFFCKENHLNNTSMWKVSKGKTVNYKGWTRYV